MAQTPFSARETYTHSHYEVLGLPKGFLDNQKDAAILLKRAYHRALLRHHPDKAAGAARTQEASQPRSDQRATFSVDDIAAAFAVLSDPHKRDEYDKALRLRHENPDPRQEQTNFQTGIENVDLDDLDFDSPRHQWYHSCRCGNDRGYLFGEDELEEVADHGELIIGCQDCSLWLRVHFAVLDDEEDQDSSPATQIPGGTER